MNKAEILRLHGLAEGKATVRNFQHYTLVIQDQGDFSAQARRNDMKIRNGLVSLVFRYCLEHDWQD